ncbi:2-hydroxychromene-2-carboxylate isomerase [Nevskia sp.]|uniref:2-hydroxychromene-2-carboxylate isomerase n=1 Tax=Nevskia sp. TaxID=1929292 RepID=UPI0025D29E0B|nr:2-hydroxychromene-2-carboxylate isomerase [Nevskia sp.]
MRHADWYFDFISPYAYFALLRLDELPGDVDIRLKPLLFAGLLNHWGQKGPAEIPAKRLWTYRSCAWTAKTLGIPFRAPAAHPFNPLPYLRLAIAAGSTRAAVHTIFEALWTTGADPSDPAMVAALAARLSVPIAALTTADTKQILRTNTESAAAAGVFGVPTLLINGELFWGVDGLDFAKAYLADPSILASEEMQRISTLPIAASRI